MPPKGKAKDAGPVERPILGRFSSHLKIGIVIHLSLSLLINRTLDRCNNSLLDFLFRGIAGWAAKRGEVYSIQHTHEAFDPS